jgi:hypothetical protein
MDVSMSPVVPTPKATGSWLWLVGLGLALAVGAVLRLAWVGDMEYKADEAWTFREVSAAVRDGSWPKFGNPCSAGPLNPGMSVWVFVLLGKATGCQDPTQLARGVQFLSLLAIAALIAFAVLLVPSKEREPWLWAAALAAVNPTAVLLQRKIWTPSVVPLFSLALLAGWWRRERFWGAFVWGLVGACLGQIHLGGFFLAAGFVLWAALFDRRRVAWGGWLLGSCLGAVPLVPWVAYLLTQYHRSGASHFYWVHLFEFKFWGRWVMQSLGFGLEYSLDTEYTAFLRYPVVNGHPTYLAWAAERVAMLVGLYLLARAAWRLWQGRRRLPELVSGKDSQTGITLGAALWGFGILLTITSLYVQRHYLAVAFPLTFVWLARLALPATGGRPAALKAGRAVLLSLCLAQAVLTATFLDYVHANQGTQRGDFGTTYFASLRAGALPGDAPAP